MHKRALDNPNSSTTTVQPSPSSNLNSSNINNNSSSNSNKSIVEATVATNQQQMLGVNGTGQKKDLTNNKTSSAILAETISTASGKQYLGQSPIEFPDDGISLDNVDQVDTDINTTLKSNNITKIDEV